MPKKPKPSIMDLVNRLEKMVDEPRPNPPRPVLAPPTDKELGFKREER